MYAEYKFQVAPIVIGARDMYQNVWESEVLISKLEIKSILGTVKICKTFLNFNDPFHDFNFAWFLHKAKFQIFI